MKYYARTNEKSFLNNYQGEGWQAVTIISKRFPSGVYECAVFPNGHIVRTNRCEIKAI